LLTHFDGNIYAIKPQQAAKVRKLHTKQIGKNLFMVELETGGFKNLICSYVIKGEKPFLVESGPTNSISNLLSGLDELDVKFEDVEYVAVTHVHLDHGGGAGTLLKSLPNAKVLVHPRGMQHLIDPERLWSSSQAVLGFVSEIFGKPEPVPKDRIIPITEGSFDLGYGAKLRVTETVGHASHNLGFQESFNGGVFPGDAAGTYIPEFEVVVPTTPPPFYLDAALTSLDKLISLKPTVIYFSHFGKATGAVQRLIDYKLQLQLWAEIAKDGVKKNQSLEEIRDRIIQEDKAMNRIIGYVKSHRIYSKTMLENCVKGFVEYAKQSRVHKSL
jgi:glyoxylase-like metal-dependent hydrolase (beta-lactamase superfamily II)